MQTFRLIRAFRDYVVGEIFTTDEDGAWFDEHDDEVSRSIFETLLDVGGYLEDITPVSPVVWTPSVGDTVFVITGAGEVKSKEFTNSDWFRLQKNFMGYYATRDEAENFVTFVRNFLTSAE